MGTRALIKIDFEGEPCGLRYYRSMDGHPDFIIPYLLGIVLPKTPVISAIQLRSLQDELHGLAERVEPEEIDEAMCSYIYSITLEPNGLQFRCRGYEEDKLVYAEIYQSISGEIWKRITCADGF
ncbi:MAG: hypothetical protein LGR52_06950 [Candidatus Thiosymbion ectosymbiont of Robbea hypermnestra]|nr:hypothetical protein [Candidatus Thiosymbion ectosymbiont of Robbea hypermnestra]